MTRPGSGLLQKLREMIGEKVLLFSTSGGSLKVAIDKIDGSTGLLHGRVIPTQEKVCFRVSCISGYIEKD